MQSAHPQGTNPDRETDLERQLRARAGIEHKVQRQSHLQMHLSVVSYWSLRLGESALHKLHQKAIKLFTHKTKT